MQWGFTGPDDARDYLITLSRLWGTWVVGLGALLFTDGGWRIAVAFGLLVAFVVLAFPIQRRAETLVPDQDNKRVGGTFALATGRGTTRDRTARALLYGEEPLREALRLAGWPALLVWLRRAIIAVTVAALVVILLGFPS